jgi:hypothetical protein
MRITKRVYQIANDYCVSAEWDTKGQFTRFTCGTPKQVETEIGCYIVGRTSQIRPIFVALCVRLEQEQNGWVSKDPA